MSPGVSVSFCCMTNHPETLWFQTTNIYLAHTVLWFGFWDWPPPGGFAGLGWAVLTSVGLAHVSVVSQWGSWGRRLNGGHAWAMG